MLTAYTLKNNYLAQITTSAETGWLEGAVWIDLVNPTEEEIKIVENFTKLSLHDIREQKSLKQAPTTKSILRGCS